MVELWLNFKDENGEVKRIPVTEEKFTIGRTPDNVLAIPIGNLSRQHAKIDKFADIFVISDSGSSNGTMLNGVDLSEPVALKNGDKVNLGGGVEIEIEMISDDPNANADGGTGGSSASGDSDEDAVDEDDIKSPASASASASGSGSSSTFGGFGFLLILVPIFGLLILAMVGGFLLISSGNGDGKEIVGKKPTPRDNFGDEDTPKPKKSETPIVEETSTPTPTESNIPSGGTTTGGNSSINPNSAPSETPYSAEPTVPTKSGNGDDNEKTRVASAQFLRKISTNDPNIFLTIKQTNVVNDKIKTVKNWSGLAENIKDAKRNSTKIQEIARSKNLMPQFLTAAVLNELGSQRGDVVAKANEIVESLADLSRVFGGELANDSLLIIAAFDGKASKGDETLNTLTKLSAEFPNRQVRSIWFMQEKNKISEPQFDKVIRFLAVGSIAQNPKEFNVNAEAVSF